MRTIGCSSVTPGIGSVIRSWWRVAMAGTFRPAAAPTRRAHAPAARDLFGEMGLLLRPAQELEATRLVRLERLARLDFEPEDLADAQHRQLAHGVRAAQLTGQTGRPRRRLRDRLVPVDQDHPPAKLGEVKRRAGPERACADDHDIRFLDHGYPPSRGDDPSLVARASQAR